MAGHSTNAGQPQNWSMDDRQLNTDNGQRKNQFFRKIRSTVWDQMADKEN